MRTSPQNMSKDWRMKCCKSNDLIQKILSPPKKRQPVQGQPSCLSEPLPFNGIFTYKKLCIHIQTHTQWDVACPSEKNLLWKNSLRFNCYRSTPNTLTVVVLKARNLPKTENNGPTGTCACKWTFEGAIHQIIASTNTPLLIVLQGWPWTMQYLQFTSCWNFWSSNYQQSIFHARKLIFS